MLVLSRRLNEELCIDGTIRVVVLAIQGNRVRLGISAPEDVSIRRSEIEVCVNAPAGIDARPTARELSLADA